MDIIHIFLPILALLRYVAIFVNYRKKIITYCMHYGIYKRITSKNLMCKKSEIGKMIYTTVQEIKL